MDTNISRFFTPKEGDHIIIWQPFRTEVGFSVLRDYPANTKFVTAKTVDGRPDTKVLIKIGFNSSNIKDDIVSLYLSISKFSNYSQGRFRHDFSHPDCPTKDSIEESERSPQPIDLSYDHRFSINLETGECYDLEDKKAISLVGIVEYAYSVHIKTISGVSASILKTKMAFRDYSTKLIPLIIVLFKNINFYLFGKDIIRNTDKWLQGIFYAYEYSSLRTLYKQEVPFFSTKIEVSKNTIIWTALSLISIWGFVPIFRNLDGIYQVSLVVIIVLIYDQAIPIIILSIINFFVWLNRRISGMRFKIK